MKIILLVLDYRTISGWIDDYSFARNHSLLRFPLYVNSTKNMGDKRFASEERHTIVGKKNLNTYLSV